MTKLHLHLRKRFEQAVLKHRMLSEGDRVLVGVSGGADSLTLLKLITGPLLFVPKPGFVMAVYVDMGFEGTNGQPALQLRSHFEREGYNYHIDNTDIGLLAHSDYNRKASPCFLCSRLRRKRLFELAHKFRCNKLALAHNKDDVIETLLLNVFFGREISTMIPYQPFFKGDFYLMRPLAYTEEHFLKRFAREAHFPVLENPCPTAKNTKRRYIKDLIKKLDEDHRGVKENIFKAMRHVKLDYLLTK